MRKILIQFKRHPMFNEFIISDYVKKYLIEELENGSYAVKKGYYTDKTIECGKEIKKYKDLQDAKFYIQSQSNIKESLIDKRNNLLEAQQKLFNKIEKERELDYNELNQMEMKVRQIWGLSR